MLLTFMVIFHTMLPQVFCKPNEIDTKYAMTEKRRLNIRVGGSILYHYFVDNFKSLERIKGNQSFLDPDMQNVAKKENYRFGKPERLTLRQQNCSNSATRARKGARVLR